MLKTCETAKETVEIFNVGSDDQIEVASIARMVADELRLRDTQFIFTGGVEGGRGWVSDVKNMLLDTTKLKSTGWKPKHNSEEFVAHAIRETISKKRWEAINDRT